MTMKKNIFCFIFLFLTNALFSQAGHIDPTFNPTDHGYGGEASATVNAVCLQPDGKILIGGDFRVYNGVNRNRIARLNADGSTDNTFNPELGPNNTVNAIACQPDGKIIIVGILTQFNNITRNRIARINPDGSLDTTFNPNIDFGVSGATLYTVAIQSDGKILFGGEFVAINGASIRRIARLNTDGSLDSSFNSGNVGAGGVSWNISNGIYKISILPDESILITGGFTTYNGVARNRIARLNSNGSLDAAFAASAGANAAVKPVGIQNDGKIIIGGSFSSYNGVNRGCIARLATDSSLDTTFTPGSGITTIFSSTDRVNSILIQSDGKIVLAGNMTNYSGNTIGHITRVNPNGSFDTGFNPGGTDAGSPIKQAIQQPDGKIIVVGMFTQYNGFAKNHITRLNSDGTPDLTFNTATGFDGGVNCTAIQNDGKILVGGYFNTCNEIPQKNIARLTADGNLDTSFNPDGVGTNGLVSAISIQTDEKIIIAGNFTTYNEFYPRNNIARLNVDGTLDFTFSSGIGANGAVSGTYLQSDGKIIVIGSFTTYNNIARNRMARLNANGSLDSTYNPITSLDGSITAIATQTDGKLILVGSFTSFNGNTANRILRLNADGTQDTSFNTGTGANTIIRSVHILPDGKILIAGMFYNFNGTAANLITRLNTDGSVDGSFYVTSGITDNYINDILVQTDGKIIISGELLTFDGVPVNNIARLNSTGTLDTTFNVSPNLELTFLTDFINTTSLQQDGKIIVGGTFTSYDGVGRNRLARLFATSPAESSTLNLKLFIQSYYTGAGSMNAVGLNQGVEGSTAQDVEPVTVELRHTTTYDLVDTAQAMLHTNGEANCNFQTAPDGMYYLAVKGRSLLQTWSANPVSISNVPVIYDFTTAANKAYGNNMIELESGVFGFYSGDINQDEAIDASDLVEITNDADASAYGELVTDLNGDGSVDNSDLPILVNNAEFSIFCNRPN